MTESNGNIITALTVQKRAKDRVNVFLDGEFAFGVDLLTAAGLRTGQRLSTAEIARLRSDDTRQQAYNRALRFLGYRPRSRAEIESYLRGKECAPAVIEHVLARLTDEGYVDDVEFARFWIENRNRFRPRGPAALRYELRQKGVTEAVIEQALQALDERDAAWAAVEKQLDRWAGLDEFTFKRKLAAYLARRGFGYGVAYELFPRAWQARQEDDAS